MSKLKELSNFVLFIDDKPEKRNLVLIEFLTDNITNINRNGVRIHCQCFNPKKLTKHELDDMKRRQILRLPALVDKNTDDVYIGTESLVRFLTKVLQAKQKKKQKKQHNLLLDPTDDDIDEYGISLMKNQQDDEDERANILRETDKRQAALEKGRKIDDRRLTKRGDFGNDDEQKEIGGDIQVNNPNNRPSTKDPSRYNDEMPKPKKQFEMKTSASGERIGGNESDAKIDDLLLVQLGLADD